LQLGLEFKTENRYYFFHKAGGTFMESLKKKSARADKIFETLYPLYAPEKTALQHQTPFQLLIATILSAQCTDKKVNEVTQVLFKKYKKPEDFLIAPLSELEAIIRPTGFYHNKAKSILGCSRGLKDLFKGRVPANMEDMLKLPGVGRKTANVVLGAAFDIPGVVVDTHVKRLSRRLGLTENEDPEKIEKDIEQLLPQERWRRFSDLLIYHGRAVCKSQKPDHAHCPVFKLCPSHDL
jgi:endonuclease-3